MKGPPPGGAAAVVAAATANAGQVGESVATDHSPAATATTTSTQQAPAAAPQATLKLRNDRGHVELNDDGFCKVSLTSKMGLRIRKAVSESFCFAAPLKKKNPLVDDDMSAPHRSTSRRSDGEAMS